MASNYRSTASAVLNAGLPSGMRLRPTLLTRGLNYATTAGADLRSILFGYSTANPRTAMHSLKQRPRPLTISAVIAFCISTVFGSHSKQPVSPISIIHDLSADLITIREQPLN